MAKNDTKKAVVEVKKDEVKKETTSTKKKTNVRKKVMINRDVEVAFMNNTSGSFFYKCPKTQNIYDMYEYGDIDYITIDELLTMRNSHRAILNNLWILVIDVNDEDIEIGDVWKYLGIEKLYDDVIKPDEIDDFIIKSKDNKFQDALEKMNKVLAKKVIERAVVLYREEKLNSISKVNILKEFTGKDELFE